MIINNNGIIAKTDVIFRVSTKWNTAIRSYIFSDFQDSALNEESIYLPSDKLDFTELRSRNNILRKFGNKFALKDGQTLFIHKGCALPRTSVTSKYKRCIKEAKADVVVYPNSPQSNISFPTIGIYYNQDTNDYFILEKYHERTTATNTIGSHVVDNVDISSYQIQITDSCNNATLIYHGTVLSIPSNNYVCPFLDSVYTNSPINYVLESDVVQTLGTVDNQLDVDVCSSIIDYLCSSDKDTIMLGLKLMSEMDWISYPNLCKHMLLKNSNYKKHLSSTPTSVKYMLTELNTIDSILTSKESKLLLPILAKEFEDYTRDALKDIGHDFDRIKTKIRMDILVEPGTPNDSTININTTYSDYESNTENN